MLFITQPHAIARLGDYINANLSDPRWTVFRAAMAFVRRSGTQHIQHTLEQFANRASVRISVGIDLNGTSREGLEDLLNATPNGEVWIFHNAGTPTFHPKVCLFKNDNQAELIVGSGNLTAGGLFTNYEAGLSTSLALGNQSDVGLLTSVENALNGWSQETAGLCHRLTPELLEQICALGLVRREAQIAATAIQHHPIPAGGIQLDIIAQPGAAPIFVAMAVPAAPDHVQAEPRAVIRDQLEETPVLPLMPEPVFAAGIGSFVMTLQQTDVGIGQVTPGTARRSPEVFIPLAALDQNTAFWTFPDSFAPDMAWNARHPNDRRNGLGKLDRQDVPMRIGVVHQVSMFFNPRKGDFRLRHEALRSSGNVGDMIWIRRVHAVNGFEFDVQVAPQGTPLFNELAQYCNTQVLNSQKRFGYF